MVTQRSQAGALGVRGGLLTWEVRLCPASLPFHIV